MFKEPASITSWPTQNLEQAVWGSRIDSSCSHAAEQTVGSQSKSTREAQRASDGGSAIQQVSNNSKLEYISSVKAIPTFSYRLIHDHDYLGFRNSFGSIERGDVSGIMLLLILRLLKKSP